MIDTPLHRVNLTAEEAERGYNNRAAVPEHPYFFARWAAESARVRSALHCSVDVRYGSRPKETMDLFPGGGRRGLLFFIHGGYWRSLDKADHSFIAEPFVELGYDVAVINYDLCPSVDIATITDECRSALQWIAANAVKQGVNASKIVIAGHSAGGHLTAMLHATDWRERGIDPSIIAGGCAISGVYDLEPLLMTSINNDLQLDEDSARALSPVGLCPLIKAPLFLAAGAAETSEFVRQTELLWDEWSDVRPAGVERPMLLEGINHFSVLHCFADASHPLFQQTVRLFG